MPLTFADIPAGAAVFIDANTFVYHITQHPTLGTNCTALLKRVEQGIIVAITSSTMLTETAHRLMTIEACDTFGWPFTGIIRRLRNHPDKVKQLTRFRLALDEILAMGVRMLAVSPPLVFAGADISQQTGLLSNDALIVAVLRDQGLTHLASHDTDFDRVPGLTRYGPI